MGVSTDNDFNNTCDDDFNDTCDVDQGLVPTNHQVLKKWSIGQLDMSLDIPDGRDGLSGGRDSLVEGRE